MKFEVVHLENFPAETDCQYIFLMDISTDLLAPTVIHPVTSLSTGQSSLAIPPFFSSRYPPNSASKWMTVVFFLPAHVELGD